MSMELFFTAQAAQKPATNTFVSDETTPGDTLDTGFLQVLLSELAAEQDLENSEDNILGESSHSLDPDLSADIWELMNAENLNPELGGASGLNLLLGTENPTPEQLDKFKSILEGLGLHNEDFKPSFGALKDLAARLDKLAEEGAPEFVLTNLTPEQIAELHAYLENPDKNTAPSFALFAELVKLTSAQGADAQALQQQVVGITTTPAQALLAKLNNLIVGGDTNKKLEMLALKAEASATNGDDHTESFSTLLRDAKAPVNLSQTGTQNQGQTLFDASILQNWPFGASGSLYSMGGNFDAVMEELGLSGQNANALNNGHLGNLITQVSQAGNTHPAAQMVAATMQKAAATGETTHINLMLNPPDLGRVEIRMQFDKSGVLKASVIAERPETYMVMQRDAQILERALQEAGVETDGDIAFELAEDNGQEFSQNGSHDDQGPYGKGGNGDEGENEETVIQSTMTWHIDPETGHTHYSILA